MNEIVRFLTSSPHQLWKIGGERRPDFAIPYSGAPAPLSRPPGQAVSIGGGPRLSATLPKHWPGCMRTARHCGAA